VQRGPGWLDAPDTDAITAAISHAASEAASDVEATAILCCTRTGRTANAMARFRPEAALLGLAPDLRTARALALTWGVTPLHVDSHESTDETVRSALERALETDLVDHGDTVLVLAGATDVQTHPDGGVALPATDMLRIVRVV
jgi:pyruvate kinase